MFDIKMMTRETATIISKWDFGEGYEFYNIEEDPYVVETFLNGHYYSVYKENILFGFFCDGDSARINDSYELSEDILDIGFAISPSFIGRGYGRSFIQFILTYYQMTLNMKRFRLTVADFNKRAIYLYEQIGFAPIHHIEERIDNRQIKFLIMVLNQS